MQKLKIKINTTNTQPFFPINKITARSNLHKSIKLGSLIKNKKQALTPVSKATWVSSEEILSSVSRKLYPDPIQIISRCNYDTESLADRKQISISCLGEFQTLSLMNFMPDFKQSITYQEMVRKVTRSGKKSLISDVHSNKGQKKGCFQTNCTIKQKWIKNVIFYQRQIKNLYILREKLPSIQAKCLQQINKDIHRSFPQNMFPKTKLTVYHAGSQKVNMIQNLKTVLKLYSILDSQVGYVQGINLVAAVIVTHMKQVDSSFIYLKQLMNYGKLRLLYIDDFSLLKKQGHQFFQLHLKDQIPDLYEHLKQWNIQPMMLIPSFYTTLFASVVDINYMHIIINQYFQNGVSFLHKFFLALLLFMKRDLLSAEEQTIVKLGSSYIKNLKIPWDEVINITQGFKDL